MTSEEALNRLLPIFHDVFDDSSIVLQRETTAADVDGWDSLAQINLIVAIEQAFKINFSFNDLKSLDTVGDMLDLIARKAA